MTTGPSGVASGTRDHGLEDLAAELAMSSPAIACDGNAPLEEVIELLADREISGLPVVDVAGHVIGILSEQDIARVLGGSLLRLALHRSARTGPFLREPRSDMSIRHARDIMTTPPVVGAPDTPLHVLANTMLERGINRVPIVEHGRLVGIVTRGDVLRAIMGHDQSGESPPRVVLGSWTPLPRRGWVTEWARF